MKSSAAVPTVLWALFALSHAQTGPGQPQAHAAVVATPGQSVLLAKRLGPETVMSHDGWYAELPAAKSKARQLGRDMLIDFGGSDWCYACGELRKKVFTQAAFNSKALKQLVCVDIDDRNHGLSAQRKKRYEQLQRQYQIGSFPSVLLATPDGVAYAWITYSDETATPEKFWASLQPLIAEGKAFREGLARAANQSGRAKVEAMISGMKEVRPDLLWRFQTARIKQLRKLDPSDRSHYLAYLYARRAVESAEQNLANDYKLNSKVTVADVDALIHKYRLQGEMLQQAEVMKAIIETCVNRAPEKALACFERILQEESYRNPYDLHGYFPLDASSAAKIRKGLDKARTLQPGDLAGKYVILNRIFEGDMPDRYHISCESSVGGTYRPDIATRIPIEDAFAEALLARTANMGTETRKKAVQEALAGSRFYIHTETFKKVLAIVPGYYVKIGDDGYVPN